MLRRLACLVAAVGLPGLVACSDCDSPCKSGITFVVGDIAGALSRGSSLPLDICFDGSCKDVTITRDQVGGSVFAEFSGIDKAGDHTISVSSTASAIKGQFTGPVYSYQQDPGGDCKSCALATVRIKADGSITPAVPAPTESTTTIGGPASTSNG